MAEKSLKEDIEDLKESTVNLGKQLSEVTREHLFDAKKLGEISKGVTSNLNRNIDQLRHKLDFLASDAAQRSKKVHETIHQKPYWFLAGALGIGMALGKYLSRRKQD